MKKFSLFSFLILHLNIFAQVDYILPLSSTVAQMQITDEQHLSAFTNPSLYAYNTTTELAFAFDNRFLIPQLSTKSVMAAYNAGSVQTGLSFSYFGYSLYHEMMGGLAFARDFSGKFALGVQFNYYAAYFNASNEYHGAFFPQIGFRICLSPGFAIAGNVFNPFQTNIKTLYSIKRLPSVFSLGGSYKFSPDFEWRLQADKEVSSSFRLASGFDYILLEKFTFKAGAYYADYLVPCLGFAWKSGQLSLSLNTELHPVLGLNSGAMVSYTFKEKH